MSSPRILLVSGEYPPMPGGIGDYTANLRRSLDDEGVGSIVFAPRGARGDDVYTVRNWRAGALSRILSLIRPERVDVVHIQYQAGAFEMRFGVNALPYAIRKRARVPVVTTFHDLRPPYLFPKAGPVRDLVMLRMARASSAVVVTNPGDERTLLAKRIASLVIPIGPNLPPPSRAEAVVNQGEVAFFGFATRSKGILDLIEALGTTSADERPRLVLIGASGEAGDGNDIVSDQEIDERAVQTGVTVQRTGFLQAQDASNRLAAAGAIAIPFPGGASLRSGSLLAALQTGRPVVTTEPPNAWRLGSVAGMRQLALVIRDDPVDLRDAILSALRTESPADPLPDEFHWREIAAKHVALYASVRAGAG